MEIQFCKNHPEQIAHYRCYTCKTPICKDCRITLRHHYFCSYSCFLKFQFGEWRRFLFAHKFEFLLLSQGILILLFLSLFFNLKKQIGEIAQRPAANQTIDSTEFSRLAPFLENYQPAYRQLQLDAVGSQEGNLYTLKMAVKKDWIVNIWKNRTQLFSRLVGSDKTIPFSIPLDFGENRVRILVLDEHQNPLYRDEILLRYTSVRAGLFSRSVRQGNPQRKMLAFTFDGGSDDAHTKDILKILREHHVHCTLFLTGKFIERHPDLVRQMVADGHEFGNHTYNHPHLTSYAQNHRQNTLPNVTRQFLQRQLLKTDSIYYRVTGKHLQPYWRAPFGEYNREILTWAAEAGFLHIRWTSGFDTYDWVTDESSKLFHTPQEVYDHFLMEDLNRKTGLNGVIVLMHLGSHRNNNHVFETLPRLIHTLQDRGYRFGMVNDLLKK